MFNADDLVPCSQCNALIELAVLDEKGICPECAYDNALIADAIGDEPDWLSEGPAYWISSITTFSF